MKKLSLDVNELTVESFGTQEIEQFNGTVHGHSGWQCSEYNPTCDGCNTLNIGGCVSGHTCQTCDDTCGPGGGGPTDPTVEITCRAEYCH